jgi:hypothetical protein
MVIKLRDNNYVQEITISGRVICCPLPYQAKQFHDRGELRVYTDFLNKEFTSKSYDVLDFTYSESLSNWLK